MKLHVDQRALVAAVERRPCLYDRHDFHYTNRTYVKEQWAEVAGELGIDELHARRKWTFLRDYFRRQHKTMVARGEKTINSKWFLYKRIASFLAPSSSDLSSADINNVCDDNDFTIEHAVDGYSCDDTDDDVVLQPPAKAMKIDPFNNTSEGDYSDAKLNTPTTTFILPSTTSSSNSKKRKEERVSSNSNSSSNNQANSLISKIDQEMLNTIMKFQEKIDKSIKVKEKEAEDKDGDELFMKSLLMRIQKFDPITKMECRGDLNAVVLKYMKKLSESQS